MWYTYLRARRRLAGGEDCSRLTQVIPKENKEGVRATEHAPRGPFRVLERRHGLAEIVEAIMFSIIRRDPRMWAKSSRPSARFFSRAAEVRSYVAVALFGLAGLLAVFGPVHGTSRQAFYALIVLKAPICWTLKRLFPALMTDAS